jgi:hypothetical protein
MSSTPLPDVDPQSSISHQLATALVLLEKYKTECDWAEQQREAAVTHALIAGDQIRTLQNKLHAKEQKETQIRRTVNTLARLMTSTEVNDAVHVQQAEKDEQERIRLEKQSQKQAQEAERERARAKMGSDVRFHGSLKSKNRSDLKDILAALLLNTADLTYNKDYLQCIEDHFNEHPHLKQDVRFWGLFHKGNPPAATIPSSLSSAEPDLISQPSQSGSDPSYAASQSYSLPLSANTAQSFAIDPRLYQQPFNNDYNTATHSYYPQYHWPYQS